MDRKKIISAIEKAKKQSEEYAQDHMIVPFKEADMILALLKEQEHKDRMFHALEEDWKRLKEQPQIVRCRDCKYYFNGCCYSMVSNRINFTVEVPDDWFCADGERVEKTNCSEYPNGSQEGW